MRFKRHIELEQGLRQIHIAPLINLLFLLLIFFMLALSLLAQPGTKVNLPKAITSEAVKYENIEIVVSGEDITYLYGKAITAPELKSMLNELSKTKQGVLIKSDKRASLGKIVEIWDMCRNSGITQINIASVQE